MKTKAIITLLAVIIFFTAQAQRHNADESEIKILPSKTGILKVLYAMEVSQSVVLTFFNSQGVLGRDKIKGNFPSGFLKFYDVARIIDREFWVQIDSPDHIIRFHVVPSKDKTTFTSYLEEAIPRSSYPVASEDDH